MHVINYKTEKDFIQAISLLKSSHLKVINQLLFLYYKHNREIFVSQRKIAKNTDYSREHVNRIVREVSSLGFVFKKKRYNTTSLYTLNAWFFASSSPILKQLLPVLRKPFITLLRNFKSISMAVLMSLPMSNVTSNSKSYIYNSPTYTISRNNEERGQGSIKKIKRKVMQELIVSPTLSKVSRELRLTSWGQIKLVIFPDSVLEYALSELKKVKAPQDAFAWFFTTCRRYADRNGIAPDWPSYYSLCQKYKMPDNPQLIMSKPTPPLEEKKPIIQRKPHISQYIPKKLTGNSAYEPYIPMNEEEEKQVKIEKLYTDIKKKRDLLDNPPEKTTREALAFLEKLLVDDISELSKLESNV